MAAILAMASMKEQLKLNNSSSSAEVSPSVTITPSRLSPNLNAENSNNSNSGKCLYSTAAACDKKKKHTQLECIPTGLLKEMGFILLK